MALLMKSVPVWRLPVILLRHKMPTDCSMKDARKYIRCADRPGATKRDKQKAHRRIRRAERIIMKTAPEDYSQPRRLTGWDSFL